MPPIIRLIAASILFYKYKLSNKRAMESPSIEKKKIYNEATHLSLSSSSRQVISYQNQNQNATIIVGQPLYSLMIKDLKRDYKYTETFFEADQRLHSVRLRYSLKAQYLLEQISLVFEHPDLQTLLSGYSLTASYNNQAFKPIDVHLKSTSHLGNNNISIDLSCLCLASVLEVVLHFESSSIEKVTGGISRDSKLEGLQNIKFDHIFQVSFSGLRLLGYNLEVIQQPDEAVNLLNIYNTFLKTKHKDSSLILMHAGVLSLTRNKQLEAHTVFKKVLATNDSYASCALLHLFACTTSKREHFQIFKQLVKLNNPDAQLIYSTNFMQKYSEFIVLTLIRVSEKHLESSAIFCLGFLNCMLHLVRSLLCSLGSSLVTIMQMCLNIAGSKKFRRMKTESEYSYKIVLQALQNIIATITSCAGQLSSAHVTLMAGYIFPRVCSQQYQRVRKHLLELAFEFISRVGCSFHITFAQCIQAIYFVEGEHLLTDCSLIILNKKYESRQHKQEMLLLYEQVKSNVLSSMKPDTFCTFISDYQCCLRDLSLSKKINFLLLHYLVDMLKIWLSSPPKYCQVLMQIYPTLKSIVSRMWQHAQPSAPVFKSLWNIYLDLVQVLQILIDDSIQSVFSELLHVYVIPNSLPATKVAFLAVLLDTLEPNQLMGVPQFAESSGQLFKMICLNLPNSVNNEQVYSLLSRLWTCDSKILSSVDCTRCLFKYLTDPYTQKDKAWQSFISNMVSQLRNCQYPQTQSLLFMSLSSPSQSLSQALSHQHRCLTSQVQMRKCYLAKELLGAIQLSSTTSQALSTQCHNLASATCQIQQYDLMIIVFQKYYYLKKFLIQNRVQGIEVDFKLFQLEQHTVTISALSLICLSRDQIEDCEFEKYFQAVWKHCGSPWKTIQQLSLLLLAHFAHPQMQLAKTVLNSLLVAEDVYKKLVGLMILYKFCQEFQNILREGKREKDLQLYRSQMASLIVEIQRSLNSATENSWIEEFDQVARYVVSSINILFGQKSEPDQQMILYPRETEESLKQVLNFDARIESILKRELENIFANSLKSAMGLPRKIERQPAVQQDFSNIVIQTYEPQAKTNNNPQKTIQSNKTDPSDSPAKMNGHAKQTLVHRRPKEAKIQKPKEVQIHLTTETKQLTPNRKATSTPEANPSQSSKLGSKQVKPTKIPKKDSDLPATQDITSSYQSGGSGSKHKHSSLVNTPVSKKYATHTYNIQSGMPSPIVVGIESENGERLKISVSDLKNKWRGALQSIHRSKKSGGKT